MTQFYPNQITIPYRDDRTYPIYLTRNGQPFDASGWKIYFNAKQDINAPDSESIIAKVIDFDDAPNDAANSTAYLIFDEDDTDELREGCHWNMRVVDADGKKQSTDVGSFRITQVVNKDGA